jgi:hypothetical protein
MEMCFLMLIYPVLDKLSDPRFLALFRETLMIIIVIIPVLLYQIEIYYLTIYHPINNNMFAILRILLLSSATTVIELSFVSQIAAISNLISWAILIVIVIYVNWKEISIVYIAVSNIIYKLIAIIFVFSLVCNIYAIVHILSS